MRCHYKKVLILLTVELRESNLASQKYLEEASLLPNQCGPLNWENLVILILRGERITFKTKDKCER